MQKAWFHIPSLGRTIDLNLVSEIAWNDRPKNAKFSTIVFLGTSLAADADFGTVYNKLAISDDADRQALRDLFLGIPITLHLNESIDDYAGEAVLDRYKDPEEFNVDR